MILRRFALLEQNTKQKQPRIPRKQPQKRTEKFPCHSVAVSVESVVALFLLERQPFGATPKDLPDLRFAIETAVEIWIRELSVGHRNVDVYPEYALLVKRSGREDLVLRLAV